MRFFVFFGTLFIMLLLGTTPEIVHAEDAVQPVIVQVHPLPSSTPIGSRAKFMLVAEDSHIMCDPHTGRAYAHEESGFGLLSLLTFGQRGPDTAKVVRACAEWAESVARARRDLAIASIDESIARVDLSEVDVKRINALSGLTVSNRANRHRVIGAVTNGQEGAQAYNNAYGGRSSSSYLARLRSERRRGY